MDIKEVYVVELHKKDRIQWLVTFNQSAWNVDEKNVFEMYDKASAFKLHDRLRKELGFTKTGKKGTVEVQHVDPNFSSDIVNRQVKQISPTKFEVKYTMKQANG